jgi:signal peptidase I
MVALLGAVAAWLALAPAQVGGAVTYVIVAGASMEPHIHAGDLVLVRSAPLYHVGDVVAYQNREMGRVVLHRIIDLQGGRYVL